MLQAVNKEMQSVLLTFNFSHFILGFVVDFEYLFAG